MNLNKISNPIPKTPSYSQVSSPKDFFIAKQKKFYDWAITISL